MTEKLRQSLSAVIDDEADEFELRRVLDELDGNPELQTLWDRYHLIGSALRGEHGAAQALRQGAMRDRIWQALDAGEQGEAQLLQPMPQAAAAVTSAPAASRSGGFRLGRYTGLAVAASVAFVVVLGSSLLDFDSEPSAPTFAGSEAGGAVAPLSTPAASGGSEPDMLVSRVQRGSEVSASDLQRAHAYMLHHTQQQALNQTGVMSFVKLATYEAP